MTTATDARIDQMAWVNLVFGSAKKQGLSVRTNRNLDRQIDFDNKSLTEDHLRRLFQDIDRKKCVYTRNDFDVLLQGSRPCAAAPFFDLSVKAGLASVAEKAEGSITHSTCVIGRSKSRIGFWKPSRLGIVEGLS